MRRSNCWLWVRDPRDSLASWVATQQSYVRRTSFNTLAFKAEPCQACIYVDTSNGLSWLTLVVRSSLSTMPVMLLFFLLVLFHEHIQPTQADYSVALPLAVRSPYLSFWIPQIAVGASHDAPYATAVDLSQVCPFSESNATKHHDPFVGSRSKICVSLSVSTAGSTAYWCTRYSFLHVCDPKFDGSSHLLCEHHE